MTDDQAVAIMATISTAADSVGVRPLESHIIDARIMLARVRMDNPPNPLALLTPEWCVRAFHRVNPGARDFAIPSLYLVDFAREVVRLLEKSSVAV